MSEPASGISEKTLIRVQAVSGLFFATFLVLHLFNTLLAPAGQEAYDSFQRAARHYYQMPVMEAGIILAVTVHIFAGVTRALRRRKRIKESGGGEAAPSLRMRLHRVSGYILLLAIYGHILATRAGDWFFGMPADFSFLTFSLTYWPAFMYPYYTLLFACGAYHLAHGLVMALRVVGAKLPSEWTAPRYKAFWTLAALSALAGFGSVLALGGNLFAVDTGRYPEFIAFWDKAYENFDFLRPWANSP
ncbi:MAG: hypothetical protein AB1405_11475 [Bdellovibrionota bacterium]